MVRAEPASALDEAGQLPITFDLTERPLHTVDLGAAYSTDLGVNLTTGWHDRNLFGNAEQLNLTGTIELGGDAVTKPEEKKLEVRAAPETKPVEEAAPAATIRRLRWT